MRDEKRLKKNPRLNLTDYNLIKAKAAYKGMSLRDLAKESEIAYSTLLIKLHNEGYFTVDEIWKIAEVLDFDGEEILQVFFGFEYLRKA